MGSDGGNGVDHVVVSRRTAAEGRRPQVGRCRHQLFQIGAESQTEEIQRDLHRVQIQNRR